jgi:hypothetical protein
MEQKIFSGLGHLFSFREGGSIKKGIDNKVLETQLSEVFRFSPIYDKGGMHNYSIEMSDGTCKDANSRFSETEDRFRIDVGDRTTSGLGKINKPVSYLGLKRLYPLAQEGEKNIHLDVEKNLTDEELKLFMLWHNNVLLLDREITAKHTKTRNKELYSPTSDIYDALGNSAGQDNLAQIIISILSFKRLKDKMGNDYPGGLLLIDELDATLYPAAQLNLIKVLQKACKDYELQVIFTTHSIDILTYTLSRNIKEFKDNTEMIFLYKRDNKIRVSQNLESIDTILEELNHSVSEKKVVDEKINIYFEDEEARIFYKNIIDTNLRKLLRIQNVNLGNGVYKNLIQSKFPEFNKSIIILDGDARNEFKRISNPKIVFLPGVERPENVLFEFLNSNIGLENFWNNGIGGYTHQVFLNNKPSIQELKDRDKMKKWFNSEKRYWGSNCNTIFKFWRLKNAAAIIKFNQDVNKLTSKINRINIILNVYENNYSISEVIRVLDSRYIK